MSIRKKTRNRLLILVAVALAGSTLVGTAYFARRWQLNNRAMAQRIVGLESAEKEDYEASLGQLGDYLGRFSERAERLEPRYADALYYYALSRQNVSEPKLNHLITAVSLWKRYFTLTTTDIEQVKKARHHLMDAQLALGWSPEAFDTAGEILKSDPKHEKSLQVRTEVLMYQRKFPETLKSVKDWIAAHPNNLLAHQYFVEATKATGETISGPAYAAELMKEHPNNPSFELLASILTNAEIQLTDRAAALPVLAKATDLLNTAASRDSDDLALIARMASLYDLLWAEALALGEKKPPQAGKGLEILKKYGEKFKDKPEYRREIAQRLYQLGDFAAIESYLASVTPEHAKDDVRLAAIKAMALFASQRTAEDSQRIAEATKLMEATEKAGKNDTVVTALCQVMRNVYLETENMDTNLKPYVEAAKAQETSGEKLREVVLKFVETQREDTEARKELKDFLDGNKVPKREEVIAKVNAYVAARSKTWLENSLNARAMARRDPLMAFLVGESAMRAGECETALQFFAESLSFTPAWIRARMRMAQLTLANGDRMTALQHADLAYAMAPNDWEALGLAAMVNISVVPPTDTAAVEKAVALVKDLQTRFPRKLKPQEEQQIAVNLSRLGKAEEAVQLLSSIKTVDPNASNPAMESVLLAQIYTRQKKYKEAQEAYDRAIALQPKVSTILAAAQLAGGLGQKDKALSIMAILDQTPTPPGEKDFAWADYYITFGTPTQVVERTLAGLKAVPSNNNAWRRLLSFCLKMGKSEQFDGYAQFNTYLAEARKAVPDDRTISYYAQMHALPGRKVDARTPSILEELTEDRLIRTIMVAHLESPDAEAPATVGMVKCLDAVVQSQKAMNALPDINRQTVAPLVDQLITTVQKIVDDTPQAYHVQVFLVGLFGQVDRYEQCAKMAIRVINAYPELAANTAAAAVPRLDRGEKHQYILDVAREWRKYDVLQPLEPDLLIADALLRLRKPTEAIAYLEGPYLSQIRSGAKKPNDLALVYIRYLRALLDSNQVPAAVDAITPMMGEKQWRFIWMQFMADFPDDKVAETTLVNLSKQIPADAFDEQLSLAVAWNVVGTRTKSDALLQRAYQQADAVSAGPGREFLEKYASVSFGDPANNLPAIRMLARWNLARKSPDFAIRFMLPLLKTPSGKDAWAEYASSIEDAAVAQQWLEAAIAPVNNGEEPAQIKDLLRLQLGNAFRTLAVRSLVSKEIRTASLKHAEELLTAIKSGGDLARDARGALALVYEYQQNFGEAAKIYKAMLEERREDVALLNNLAFMYTRMKDKKNAGDAIGMITQAIRQQPRVAALYDTQASVYAVLANDHANALRSIDQAINLERSNVNWKVSRIWILALSGDRAKASQEYLALDRQAIARELMPEGHEKLKEVGFE